MTDNIKPVLTDERVSDCYYSSGYNSQEYDGGANAFARAIEREVLLATRDCRLCGNYAYCVDLGSARFFDGKRWITCINGSHYTPTEEKVELWKKG